MLVGGLNVSTTQLCKEWFTIGSLVCSINSSSNAALSGTMLAVSYSAALLCSGRSWTNRWPITFPLVPLAAIQLVRICSLCDERLGLVSKWCSAYSWNSVGRVSSNLLVLIAAILSMLFPALRLPHIRGPYRVGVIDLFLPVNMPKPDSFSNTPTRNGIADQERTSGELQLSNYQQYTTARIFYPTFDSERRTMPYLDDEMAPLLCNALMKFGAPSPLKCAGWLLHTWRQIRIPAARNAPMLPFQARKTQLSNRDDSCQGKKLQGWPVAVYSHGWKGNAATYSFMGLSLAANGFVCLMPDHRDGSAPVVKIEDGSYQFLDDDIEEVSISINGVDRRCVYFLANKIFVQSLLGESF